MKVTIIGAGNMGGAAARGWLKNAISGQRCKDLSLELTVADASRQQIDDLYNEFSNVLVTTDNCQAVKGADLVVVAVKPWLVKGVIDGVKDCFTSDTILVSFAAGISVSDYQQMLLGSPVKNIFHAIPNIAAEFASSMTFISVAQGVPEETTEVVTELFEVLGSVIVCPEKLLDSGMLMASCGIAYVMRFIRAQMEAGVEMGFSPKDSLDIAIQTMRGATELLRSTGEHPEAAIDRVTTPGGYTIKGLNELDHARFNSAVIKAFKTGYKG